MYAVIESGSKQYRVAEGDVIEVESLPVEAGKEVELERVLMITNPEGIKVGMPMEVQNQLESLLLPLGRELRASIDFFEHQQDKTVSQVFVSGGAARSPFIVESLQTELMVQTRSWNPLSFMNMALPAEKLGEVEQVASQLAVATGGGIASL